ncbi:MAG: gluconokinase [Chloroflexota bacterium]
MSDDTKAKILIIMGVSGCGKSTIGALLAEQLAYAFYDGDDFHPDANIEKMSNGIPLTDADRMPWLDNLRQLIDKHLQVNKSAIIACSALKENYRERIKQADERVIFVYLHGDFDLIWSRMSSRKNHFMKADMLRSQFEALERPSADEAYTIPINQSVAQIIAEIKVKIV